MKHLSTVSSLLNAFLLTCAPHLHPYCPDMGMIESPLQFQKAFDLLSLTDVFDRDVVVFMRGAGSRVTIHISRPTSQTLGKNGRKPLQSLATATFERGFQSLTLTNQSAPAKSRSTKTNVAGQVCYWMNTQQKGINEFELRIDVISSNSFKVTVIPIPYTPDKEILLQVFKNRNGQFRIIEAEGHRMTLLNQRS